MKARRAIQSIFGVLAVLFLCSSALEATGEVLSYRVDGATGSGS